MDFVNFQLFVKISPKIFNTLRSFHALTARASMDNIPVLNCQIRKELTPRRDTFEVGIDLLTAVSSRRRQCDGLHVRHECAMNLRSLQKSLFAKI